METSTPARPPELRTLWQLKMKSHRKLVGCFRVRCLKRDSLRLRRVRRSATLTAIRTGGLLSKCCEFYTCALGRKGKILRCHSRTAAKEIYFLQFVFR